MPALRLGSGTNENPSLKIEPGRANRHLPQNAHLSLCDRGKKIQEYPETYARTRKTLPGALQR